MTDAARRHAGTYSLGMRQRLGIAGALLGDPEILMLDEPVNGLDLTGIRWIRSLLRSLADEGRTVFVSSHLMSEMEQTADRLVMIGRGELLVDEPMASLLTGTGTSVRGPCLEPLADAYQNARWGRWERAPHPRRRTGGGRRHGPPARRRPARADRR
jgi:ABC-2 type transport system ATP-binding protein